MVSIVVVEAQVPRRCLGIKTVCAIFRLFQRELKCKFLEGDTPVVHFSTTLQRGMPLVAKPIGLKKAM
jgi:hypothetical protein